jgi:hypothetical protein
MSKGSSQRPTNKSSYDKNYDRIFKNKNKKPTKYPKVKKL